MKPSLQYHSNLPNKVLLKIYENSLTHKEERTDVQKYKGGAALFDEGLKATQLYYIIKGNVKLFKHGSEGKKHIIRILDKGEFFGYKDILFSGYHTCAAEVFNQAEILTVEASTFVKLYNENREITNAFSIMLCHELAIAQNKMVDLAFKPVRGRLAEAIISLVKSEIEKKSAIQLEESKSIAISRGDLAMLIGTAKETVVRMLSELKQENIITTKGSLIKVLNINGLERISRLYN